MNIIFKHKSFLTILAWGQKIRDAATPKEVAKMGRDRRYPLRPNWEEVKDEIMKQGVLWKFQTHKDIRGVLLGTRDEILVENSPIDYYWGCGADSSGKNRLGEILMVVREILKNQ